VIEELFWCAYGVPGSSVDLDDFHPRERELWLRLLVAQKAREAEAMRRGASK
jgi:hypothetical protein